MTRKHVQDVLDWCRHEIDHPSQNWHYRCMSFARQAWDQPPWAITAKLAWARVPAKHRHYTHFSKVPAGAVCFGLFNTRAGHAWISARGDYKRDGHVDRCPVNLPAWTNDSKVHWTDWSPWGMLPIWDDPRNKGLRPTGCK